MTFRQRRLIKRACNKLCFGSNKMMPMNYIRAGELSQSIRAAVMMALRAFQTLNKTLSPRPITVYGLAVPAVHTQYEEKEQKGAAISSIQRRTPI
ncbi:hypothetical protein LOY55_19110 [Pseudomonas sp. B21-040]|uniref:hypothetical protein n=1 Tax=Pseudomonas sp. B21-040 TaxID=2895486 RepID=UPI00215F706D|nr:hypothetical protein [Pseudomonas sp. B21-040]UVL38363.1 hypothetical protein LOY55_19110 [Pseudomonas sp. B21-040]